MKILNHKQAENTESADSGRRSFFWKLAAGVSAAVAGTAAIAGPGDGESNDLSSRVARLEDEKSLRQLHREFEQALDAARHDEVIGLFADNGEVVFGNDIYAGRRDGVSRLFRERFPAGKTGKRMEPAPGYELDAAQLTESVDVSDDRMTATARFPYSIQVGEAFDTESSLASMARVHGEGVRTWWEGGIYEVSYRRDAAEDRWEIARLEYRTLSRADFRPGRTWAKPLT